MDRFEFHGELFEVRTAVIDRLASEGFVWLSNYGAVDLLHDIYGLEVTMIAHEGDALAIERILCKMLPGWHFRRTYFEDLNVGEIGWKVMVSRKPECFEDPRLNPDPQIALWKPWFDLRQRAAAIGYSCLLRIVRVLRKIRSRIRR